MIKKIFLLLLCLAMCFSLFACNDEIVQGPQGEPGATGSTGPQGPSGITPQLKVGEDNYWYVSYDNGTTWASLNVKATGADGEQGPQGEPGATGVGIESVEFDEDGNLVIKYTDGTATTVETPKKEEHQHTFGAWVSYGETQNIDCENICITYI